jgi:hypothetical protein
MMPSSINQALGHFVAAPRWAQRMGLVERIPRVERIKAPKSRVPKYLDAEPHGTGHDRSCPVP